MARNKNFKVVPLHNATVMANKAAAKAKLMGLTGLTDGEFVSCSYQYSVGEGATAQVKVGDLIGVYANGSMHIFEDDSAFDSSNPESVSSKIDELDDAIDLLNSDENTPGSVDNKIKTKIETLDYTDGAAGETNEDYANAHKVVVAVSETDGVIAPVKQTLSIVKVADSSKAATNAAEYQVKIGNVALDTKIEIPYAGSVLADAKLGHIGGTVAKGADGSLVYSDGPATADAALQMIFKKGDGSYVIVETNVESFLEETEFKNGLKVDNHEVSVDLTSGGYLQFDGTTEGAKTVGVTTATVQGQATAGTANGVVLAADAYSNIGKIADLNAVTATHSALASTNLTAAVLEVWDVLYNGIDCGTYE